MKPISISIDPRRVLLALVGVVLTLVALGVAANLVFQARPGGGTAAITRLLLLDNEDTIPTYVSSIVLGLCSLLLVLRGLSVRRRARPLWVRWVLLGILFASLSMDEIVQIHERWDVVIRAIVGDPTLSGGWVFVAAILVGITAAVWLPLLLSLTGRERLLWILAGALYLGGTLVLELISKPYEPPETARLAYVLLVGLEEGMEMLGVSVFLYALLEGIAGGGHLDLVLRPEAAES